MSTARAASLPTLADIERPRDELLNHLSRCPSERPAQMPLGGGDLDDQDITEPEPEEPSTLAPAARHGLAGEFIRRLAPHSEADPTSSVGLSKTQIRGLFHGHISVERIDRALDQLAHLGLIYSEAKPGPGRTTTLWSGHGTPEGA